MFTMKLVTSTIENMISQGQYDLRQAYAHQYPALTLSHKYRIYFELLVDGKWVPNLLLFL